MTRTARPPRLLARLAAALLALAALPAAAANPLETIDVLCGGTATEERARLEKEVIGATVVLEFYSGTKGQYVADVDVLFSPLDAPIPAFGIVTGAPVCLIELPPGDYRVYTWYNGHARSTTATVPRSGSRALVRISLGFPQERGNDAFLVPVSERKTTEKAP